MPNGSRAIARPDPLVDLLRPLAAGRHGADQVLAVGEAGECHAGDVQEHEERDHARHDLVDTFP